MARIQEYNAESEGAGPVGGLDPRVEASSAVGQSLEHLGGVVEHEGEIIHHREAQSEVSGISAQVSQAHVDFNQMLQQQTADGSLDVDQMKQKLNDWSDEAGQGIATAEGRNYFNKMSGRLKLAITQSAIHGSAQIAAAQATADWQTSRNAQANNLYQDPSALGRIVQDNEDEMDARVASGSIPAKKAPDMLKQANAQAAFAAIDGWSRIGDTGSKDDKGNPISGASIAKTALDQGQYDKFLSPKEKEEAYGHLDRAIKANEAFAAQQEAQAKRAARAKFDDFLSKNMSAYANGTLSAKTVLNADLPAEAAPWQLQLIDKLKTNARTEASKPSDPRVVADYMYRLSLPDGDKRKITNPEDVWLDHAVRPKDAAEILHLWSSTPAGQNLNKSRSMVMDAAKSQIVQKDLFGNHAGHDKLAEFYNDMAAKESAADQSGQSRRDLYDPTKPGNLYDLLKSQKYQNPNNPLNALANDQRRNVLPSPTPPGPIGDAPDVMQKNLQEYRAKKKTAEKGTK